MYDGWNLFEQAAGDGWLSELEDSNGNSFLQGSNDASIDQPQLAIGSMVPRISLNSPNTVQSESQLVCYY